MLKIKTITTAVILSVSLTNLNGLDCPADSAYHLDNRTQVSDGQGGTIDNPTYGDTIFTGLCACLGFNATLSGNDSSLTFTILVVDNEPIRGVEIDIYHDQGDLISNSMFEPYNDLNSNSAYDSGEPFNDWNLDGSWTPRLYDKGEKLTNVQNQDGSSASSNSMQLVANDMGGYVKIMAYNTNQVQTEGDGSEGELLSITFGLPSGQASLPENISFGLGFPQLPGTSQGLLNVVCSYPDTFNMNSFSSDFLAVDESAGIPETYSLNQNFPNPFNPTTQISFDLPQDHSQVKMTIYNLLGHRIATLVDGALPAGRHRVDWNGLDAHGKAMASGMYFYELQADGFTARKKMLLLR